ncbi:MAG: YqaJ viral recombinase family protein [candidate division WOR-3 bacterium]
MSYEDILEEEFSVAVHDKTKEITFNNAKIVLFNNEEEWVRFRRHRVTGTDVAKILQYIPGIEKVYLDKVCPCDEMQVNEMSPRMILGRELEPRLPHVCNLLFNLKFKHIGHFNSVLGEYKGVPLSVSLDGYLVEDNTIYPVEVKCTSPYSQLGKARNIEEVPNYIKAQIGLQCHLLNVDKLYLVRFTHIDNNGLVVFIYRHNREEYEKQLEIVREFWVKYVIGGEVPEFLRAQNKTRTQDEASNTQTF